MFCVTYQEAMLIRAAVPIVYYYIYILLFVIQANTIHVSGGDHHSGRSAYRWTLDSRIQHQRALVR